MPRNAIATYIKYHDTEIKQYSKMSCLGCAHDFSGESATSNVTDKINTWLKFFIERTANYLYIRINVFSYNKHLQLDN